MRFVPLEFETSGRTIIRRARAFRFWRGALLVSTLLVGTTSLALAAVHQVAQRNRSFSVREITIARGDTIAFSNDDEFLHQIYIDSMDFDSAEQRPGETIRVNFPQPGSFPVRCHIHPKMLLTVHVK